MVIRFVESVEGTVAGPLMLSVASMAVDVFLREVLAIELAVGEVNLVTPTVAGRGVAEAGTVLCVKGEPASKLELVSGQDVFPGAEE